MTHDEKRESLRQKIEAGEARHAQRSVAEYARDAREGATRLVKDHPIATLAGALAVGALIAAVVPARGRRFTLGLGRRALSLASLAAEFGMAYGSGLLDTAGKAALSGKDKLEDFGDSMEDGARTLRREAGHRASIAADGAATLRRTVAKKTGRAVRDLRNRMN